ncbi:MAG: nitrogenase component 1 [Deltaproteobacteria bacterium]|jgi:nitrogenase molybdenum-iron protein alpha chain|nr:nitrogenase component 1 [Deltaproteobacteria bacterium]
MADNNNLLEGLVYNYTSATEPPTRDVRIEPTNAYLGSCHSLKRAMGQGCAKFNSRYFSQGNGCQLNLALGIVRSFQNVVIIIHGPLGCGSNNIGLAGFYKTARALKGKPANDVIWIHTNLDESDVINGGVVKLREAVLYAEREYRPDVVVVGNSCVPGIIGDDIDSALEELEPQVSAKLVPIHCEGFRSRFVASGYDAAYHGLLKKLADPPVRIESVLLGSSDEEERLEKIRRQNSRTVNLLNVGSTSRGDEVELSRILSSLGLTVNVLPLFGHIDEIAKMGEAGLNISICATHDDYLIGHLKERFGTPYVIDTLPIGIKNTNQWLRAIGEAMNLKEETEKLIELETSQLLESLEPFKATLAGKTLWVGGGETRIFTTAEFFQSLGMKVLGLKPHNFDRFAIPMLDDIEDPETAVAVAAGQPAEELVYLKRLKPDLYVGHGGANGWVLKLGIPTIPLYGQSQNYMGYSGAFELARKAARALLNTNLSKKISANVPLPFKQVWYDSNPQDNIKEGQQEEPVARSSVK